MEIKIINAEVSDWYYGKVGAIYRVQGETDRGNFFVNDFGSVKVVENCDCEIVVETPSEADNVNSPSHYTNARFETIEVIEEITAGYSDGFVAYSVGNALKYLARAPFKHDDGGLEDLRKAAKYLEFAIKRIEAEEVGE